MTCPKCGLPVEDDTFFCEHCGAPLDSGNDTQNIDSSEDMEKTRSIPAIKPGMGSSPAPERTTEAKTPPKKTVSQDVRSNKGKELRTKIILTLVSFLVTLMIGAGICALVIFTDDSSKTQTETTAQEGEKTEQTENGDTDDKKKPVRIVEGSAEAEKPVKVITIDTEYDFALGCTLASSQLSYKTLRNTEFEYSCGIPTSFVFVSDTDGEIRYRAADNTAYMDVGAFENSSSLSCDEIKTKIKEELNGETEREEDGDNWFIMTTRTNDVVYYIKCFVGESVKYIKFVNPVQYREVYDVFISDVEPLFREIE